MTKNRIQTHLHFFTMKYIYNVIYVLYRLSLYEIHNILNEIYNVLNQINNVLDETYNILDEIHNVLDG